ncbi:MAG: gfo/Idh/MocA family oxidoreductase [Bacteroidota bacterium]
MNEPLLLVGAGPMAIEYTKVLLRKGVQFDTVCRREETATKYKNLTGISARTGGIEKWLDSRISKPSHAIVAVDERELGDVTLSLLRRDVKTILVEKPGGFDFNNIVAVDEASTAHQANVLVGYNRRFYTSVLRGLEIINEDGGVKSFHFEFTEWSHVIATLEKAEGVKAEWFLHNSTHVIDLAFFIGGRPEQLSCYVGGELQWHPCGSIFAGAGKSEQGVLFSYQANWAAPGRWGIEILTRKHRLIFRPLERLQIQNVGSLTSDFVELDDKLDRDFKPGLWRQVTAFLEGNYHSFVSISDQRKMLKFYAMMLGNPQWQYQ